MVILEDEPAKEPNITKGILKNLQIPYNRPERVLWGDWAWNTAGEIKKRDSLKESLNGYLRLSVPVTI